MITKEHGIVGLIGICLVVLILAVAGLASDFVTRLIGNIDGLLLLFICLMMVLLFAGMLFAMGKEEGWIPTRHHSGDSKPAEGK